jgi:hypothetical protein
VSSLSQKAVHCSLFALANAGIVIRKPRAAAVGGAAPGR